MRRRQLSTLGKVRSTVVRLIASLKRPSMLVDFMCFGAGAVDGKSESLIDGLLRPTGEFGVSRRPFPQPGSEVALGL